MVAFGVAALIVTFCAEEYVPAAGLKAGAAVGGVIVYTAELTELEDSRAAFWSFSMPFALSATTAMAFRVSVAETVIGPMYTGELVVGVAPSVV
jgi:hypothetical protein